MTGAQCDSDYRVEVKMVLAALVVMQFIVMVVISNTQSSTVELKGLYQHSWMISLLECSHFNSHK